MLLKAALNGDRSVAEHPNIPISPEQVAADVQAAVALGVDVIHVHPRAQDGKESLHRSEIEPLVLAIRERCPTILFGISTGEWIEPDIAVRLSCISGWRGLVDFASVNFSEARASEIASQLLSLGIGVEAGLFHADAARALAESGLAEQCLRIMFEPIDPTIQGAIQTVDEIEAVLAAHQIKNRSRLLHGMNETTWPLLKEAKQRGYDTRIGFEDTLLLPTGEQADSNADLIDTAQKLLNINAGGASRK